MTTTSTYPEAVETHLYWNLLKDLSETVKIQLVVKLKDSLATKATVVEDADAQAAYYDILNKLKTYQGYAKGWDGEDASPLTQKVVANVRDLLKVIDKHLLQGLTIYPETNGTLLIDSTKREAGISLGDDSFSYYEINGNEVSGENAIPFSVTAITKVIKQINR